MRGGYDQDMDARYHSNSRIQPGLAAATEAAYLNTTGLIFLDGWMLPPTQHEIPRCCILMLVVSAVRHFLCMMSPPAFCGGRSGWLAHLVVNVACRKNR